MAIPLENPQFTCISCAIAFVTADEQRVHYKSDHHRYNMKRRVAGLPPVDPAAFNEKVMERRAETALTTSAKGKSCQICHKSYTTENAYNSHITSKKHREQEAKASSSTPPVKAPKPETVQAETSPETPEAAVDADGDAEMGIEERIAASRSRIPPTSCLFCPTQSPTVDANVAHMAQKHGLFIPDREYLVDLPGLLTYLGEKIAVHNVCLWCNGKGKGLRSLEAVRRHMYDKSHCKIAYDTERDRLEISDYYDFTASYGQPARVRSTVPSTSTKKAIPEEEWEDDEEMGEEDADEVVAEDGSSEEEVDLEAPQVTYGDTHYELVLPSGARIGHRSLKRYYNQKFSDPLPSLAGYTNSESAVVKRLLKDGPRSALIPASGGGFGGSGKTIKVRTIGEAREAGKHIREHRQHKEKEAFRTRVGLHSNSKKHFRVQLLQ